MSLPSKVLYIDLTKRKYWSEDRGELFQLYLGGSGVAIRLLEEECPRGADPLGPENPIIFAVGPLNGVLPIASKTVTMFKSPLTGNLGESHAGGRSAIAIRSAGYGAIVIKGASDIPVYLAIHGDKVFFRDARALWGMSSAITVGRVIRELEPSPGTRSIMRIGRAGENLVRYAAVMLETYRHFGRLGLGAVFGSKKLKAVVVSGTNTIQVKDRRLFRQVYDEIYELSIKSPLMRKYYELGTPFNINPLNEIKALPVKNLKEANSPLAKNISGELMAEKFLGRRVACAHCPVACIHLAALREPYVDEKYFYKTTMISYDYEPSYALGSMIGVFDPQGLLKLLDVIEVLGLDAMSTGVALAWATEALEHGVITVKETEVELKWGDHEGYIKAIHKLAGASNEFYKALGMGVERASEIYGGRDFALSFGKNEMPGYHTGPLAHIGCLTGARHSHLDSAGYSVDQKYLKEGKLPDPEKGADELVKEEAWRQVLTSLVICLFARKLYDEQMVIKSLKILGIEWSGEELRKFGMEVLKAKNKFKFREGFDPNKLRIPERILETPSPHGRIDREYIERAIKRFYENLA
jgi:aldehyde:ferredoxin oxidoreductase